MQIDEKILKGSAMRNECKTVVLWGVMIMLAGAGSAAPEAAMKRFTSPPKIDGDLNEICWEKEAAAIAIPGSEPTDVLLGYDDDQLYVAFKCRHHKPENIKSTEFKRDGNIFMDDSVEVFLDTTHDHASYYQLAVNAAGTKFDGVRRKDSEAFSTSWDGEWEAKTKKVSDGFRVEMAIPFRILRLGTNTVWGANFCRNSSRPSFNLSWAKVDLFHQPEKFGHLAGLSAPKYQTVTIERMPVCRCKIGENTYQVEVRNNGQEVRPVEGRIDYCGEYSAEFAYQAADKPAGAKRAEIGAQSVAALDMPFNIGDKGLIRYRFSLKDVISSSSNVIYTEVFKQMIESPIAVRLQSKVLFPREPVVIRYQANLSSDMLKDALLKIDVCKDGQPLITRTVAGKELKGSAIFIQSDLPAGAYIIRCELFQQDRRVYTREDAFEIMAGF